MNRFKRLQLFHCLLLVCCVGFLLTNSISVHAASVSNYYSITTKNSLLFVYYDNDDWANRGVYEAVCRDDKHYFSNGHIAHAETLEWYPDYNDDGVEYIFDFPYNPDVYDYYVLGNMVALNQDLSKSTFKPTRLEMYGLDHATASQEYYPMSNVGIYDIDSNGFTGFGWHAKVDFGSRDNIGITNIYFMDDKDGFGSKPANLIVSMGVLAVEKSTSSSDVNQEILNQLQKMETSITENILNAGNAIQGAIGESAEKITGAIEDQYEMSEEEDFGINEIKGDVEEKLGVLNFTADTLTSFLDLFNAETVGDTTITFPSFSIEVQGESYTVWNNIEFDFAFLEEHFGILITAVRTVTVLCVWLALLSYLGKAKDQIIANRG